jgi:uncharacterized membrane protein YraQ (UPF0718 family)
VSIGFNILFALFLVLLGLAIRRREAPGPIVKRGVEQLAKLLPRMVCALIAAGFVAELLPKALISAYLGAEAGWLALPVAAATGLLIPAGPVITFAIAAVFAKAGASPAALITFVTSWSIFAAHRILIYELPLLGPSFFRMRVLSALIVPFLAGMLAMIVGAVVEFGTPVPAH